MENRAKILAVIVLYKLRPEESKTFVSLQEAVSQYERAGGTCEILLFDNTPGEHRVGELPAGVTYEKRSDNPGLAVAYNRALDQAAGYHCEWLLTLDQDTALPADFLVKVSSHAEQVRSRPEVAAIVPQLWSGGRRLSPNRFVAGAWPQFSPAGYVGIAKERTFAFNSGALLRVEALQSIGGFDPRFWLDYCDAYLFSKLQKNAYKVFVAGDIPVQHQFSMLDFKNSVSVTRYANIVEAGSAFWDLEMNALARLDHTARLMFRLLKHWWRGDDPAFVRITLRGLRERIFKGKDSRLSSWEQGLRNQGRLRDHAEMGSNGLENVGGGAR